MKKNVSRLLVIVFLLTIILSSVSHASMEASLYLQFYNAYFTKNGNSIITHFQVEGTSIMDYVGVTDIYLYEREDENDSWSLVYVYLSSDPNYSSAMMGTHTGLKVDDVSYSGNASYQYKAYITCYAEKNGGSDSRGIIIYS